MFLFWPNTPGWNNTFGGNIRLYRRSIADPGVCSDLNAQVNGDSHPNEDSCADMHLSGKDSSGGYVYVVLQNTIVRDNRSSVYD